jgi:hypothetical protein
MSERRCKMKKYTKPTVKKVNFGTVLSYTH